MSISFEIQGLKNLENKCKQLNDGYNYFVNEFMRFEAQKLTKKLKDACTYKTFKKGYYTKTNKNGGVESWKAIKNKAPHLHLVRDGHKKVLWGRATSERVEGKRVFTYDVPAQFAKEYEDDLKKYMDGEWEKIVR